MVDNVFVEGLKKNLGRKVTVVMFLPDGKKMELSGSCEGIDFGHKSIIIRDDKNTYLIPHYLYLIRERRFVGGDKNGLQQGVGGDEAKAEKPSRKSDKQ